MLCSNASLQGELFTRSCFPFGEFNDPPVFTRWSIIQSARGGKKKISTWRLPRILDRRGEHEGQHDRNNERGQASDSFCEPNSRPDSKSLSLADNTSDSTRFRNSACIFSTFSPPLLLRSTRRQFFSEDRKHVSEDENNCPRFDSFIGITRLLL